MKKFEIHSNSKGSKRKVLVMMVTFLLTISVLFIGIYRFSTILDEQNLILTEQSIKKAIVQCYAMEGFYPAELSYLEENYYLTIDYDSYNVYYDCFASNLPPDIEVFER